MKKIEIFLQGGLGNQLFGYALALAIKNRIPLGSIVIKDDFIGLGSNPKRKLMLDDLTLAEKTKIKITKSKHSPPFFVRRYKLLRKTVLKFKYNSIKNSVIKDDFSLPTKFLPSKKLRFFGYFQDWFYIEFASSSSNFMPLPTVQSGTCLYRELENLVEQDLTVVVHIRLGDFLDFPGTYTILPTSFYQSALGRLRDIHQKNVQVVVFTENKEQARAFFPNLVEGAVKVVDSRDPVTDVEVFAIMCRAKNLIAANSTFSMWAAWYCQRHSKNAFIPVSNEELSIKDGSRFFNWHIFDLAQEVWLPDMSEFKSSWMNVKRDRFFDKLLNVTEEN